MSEDLSDVAVDDLMIIEGRYDQLSRVRVLKITKSQIVVTGNRRFRRDNGRLIGADWTDTTYLVRPTLEHQVKIEHDRLCYELCNVNWRKLTTEQLRRVRRIVHEGKT